MKSSLIRGQTDCTTDDTCSWEVGGNLTGEERIEATSDRFGRGRCESDGLYNHSTVAVVCFPNSLENKTCQLGFPDSPIQEEEAAAKATVERERAQTEVSTVQTEKDELAALAT